MTSRDMKSGLDSRNVGVWLQGQGQDSDILVSSRIRLARNVAGVRFLSKASPQERSELLERVDGALKAVFASAKRGLVNVDDFSPLEAQFLMERHLVSPDFLKGDGSRGFFTTGDESFSLMVNEEDHLRLQMLGSGLSLV